MTIILLREEAILLQETPIIIHPREVFLLREAIVVVVGVVVGVVVEAGAVVLPKEENKH